MSSRVPATVTFSLSVLAEHGGKTAPHKDGWGIAYYEGSDIRILRDTNCASNSPLVQFVQDQNLRSTLVLSHIRKATEGAVAIRNTQPFSRELGGRMHTFSHNGHLPDIRERSHFCSQSYRPVGDTDSEVAFCALLDRIKWLWHGRAEIPDVVDRLEIVTEFARDLRDSGLANFIYCDSETIFAHGHRRKQANGKFEAPGLHLLQRHCLERDSFADSTGVSANSQGQEIVLVASVPLTNEAWIPIREGQVVAISNGQIAVQDGSEEFSTGE